MRLLDEAHGFAIKTIDFEKLFRGVKSSIAVSTILILLLFIDLILCWYI